MENPFTDNLQVTTSLDFNQLDNYGVKCEQSFSDSSSELDEDKCYIMEIEQLKRENNFLRRKIEEMNKKKRISAPLQNVRRPSFISSCRSESQLPEQRNYIISFIDEIVKLLQSFSSLFEINLDTSLLRDLDKQNGPLNSLTTDKNQQLNRRLSKLTLQPEENKYRQLLDIFEGYYRENTEKTKQVRSKVQKLTTDALELGKQMASSIKERETVKKSIKGSRFFSVIKQTQKSQVIREDCMNSSMIKSTCDDGQRLDLAGCKAALGKDKMLFNLF